MYQICVRCPGKQAAKRVTNTARHIPFPSPFLPAWDAVHEKRGHTLRCAGIIFQPQCSRVVGLELILTSCGHHKGRIPQCLDAAIMQGKWETPAMAPSRLVHCSRNMSEPWRDTTKWPRLLRDVG
jgi:hypothetical protein